MNKTYKAKDLYNCELRFFDKENYGVELTPPISYGLIGVELVGGEVTYKNILGNDKYPIFKRSSCYSNSYNGEDFGTKMIHVTGELKTGPCWIINNPIYRFSFNEELSMDEVEDMIINSKKYYIDREAICKKRINEGRDVVKMVDILDKDEKDRKYFDNFLSERDVKVKIKK